MSWPRQLERPVDREQLRRRALAFAGIWFLLAGMLAALGVSIVLSLPWLCSSSADVVVAALWLIRRYEIGSSNPSGRAVDRAGLWKGAAVDRARLWKGAAVDRSGLSGRLRPSIEHASRKLRSSLDELDAGQRLGRLANGAAHQARHALEVRPQKPAATRPATRGASTQRARGSAATRRRVRTGPPSNIAPRWRSCASWTTRAQRRSRSTISRSLSFIPAPSRLRSSTSSRRSSSFGSSATRGTRDR